MKQAALNLNLCLKKTRKREFLEQMDAAMVQAVERFHGKGFFDTPLQREFAQLAACRT